MLRQSKSNYWKTATFSVLCSSKAISQFLTFRGIFVYITDRVHNLVLCPENNIILVVIVKGIPEF